MPALHSPALQGLPCGKILSLALSLKGEGIWGEQRGREALYLAWVMLVFSRVNSGTRS